ncbi:MAG: NAD(P)/FAD-dependent oxidoreductase [Aquabacterium sp.]
MTSSTLPAVSATRSAIVVGAGIVGICCGIELQRRGWTVTVIDRLDPGQACSWGNAGILAAHAVVPVALPGLLPQVPGMLLRRDGPLVLRRGSLRTTLPWLRRFIRAGEIGNVRRAAGAMKALYGPALDLHQALAREAGVPQLIRDTPGLYVHRDPAGIDGTRGIAWQLRREHGARIEVLEGAALREAEPALSPAYTRAVRMGPMGYTTHPYRLTHAYAALFARLGGRLLRAEVRAVRPREDAVQVQAGDETLDAAVAVVAAGAWTAPLLRPLGLDLPLIAERGYHMTFAEPGIRLNHVVSEVQHHFAVTPMDMGLRVAGTEELGLPDEPPAWRRAEALARHAQRLFPTATLTDGSRWMGPRPGLPDSLPAIGAVPGHPQILVAAGHGHLGLTGGPHTGRIVAGLLSGEAVGVSMAPYSPGRFAR